MEHIENIILMESGGAIIGKLVRLAMVVIKLGWAVSGSGVK